MNKSKLKKKLRKEGRILKTFHQWNVDGYTIIKGSKSPCRSKNRVPLFTDLQVIKSGN